MQTVKQDEQTKVKCHQKLVKRFVGCRLRVRQNDCRVCNHNIPGDTLPNPKEELAHVKAAPHLIINFLTNQT